MNETGKKEEEKDSFSRLLLWNGGLIVLGSLEKHKEFLSRAAHVKNKKLEVLSTVFTSYWLQIVPQQH